MSSSREPGTSGAVVQGDDELRQVDRPDREVGVGRDDERRARDRDTETHGRALAPILGLLDEQYVRQVAVDVVRDLHRVVARTVVDHDHFDRVGVHLVEHRAQSLEAGRESQ